MATLGTFDYPDTTIDDAIEAAKKVAKQFKAQNFGRSALATCLGYKTDNSGAFNQRLADLRRFGLIEGRGEDMRATELAHKLAAPASALEYSAAATEMVFKIPLYKALHDHYQGQAPTEEDFFTTLLNTTKADRQAIVDQAVRLRNLFISGMSKVGANGGATGSAPPSGNRLPNPRPDVMQQPPPPPLDPPPPSDFREYRDGQTLIRVPKNDPEELEQVIGMMQGWLKTAQKAKAVQPTERDQAG